MWSEILQLDRRNLHRIDSRFRVYELRLDSVSHVTVDLRGNFVQQTGHLRFQLSGETQTWEHGNGRAVCQRRHGAHQRHDDVERVVGRLDGVSLNELCASGAQDELFVKLGIHDTPRILQDFANFISSHGVGHEIEVGKL